MACKLIGMHVFTNSYCSFDQTLYNAPWEHIKKAKGLINETDSYITIIICNAQLQHIANYLQYFIVALGSAGFLNLSDDCDIILDDDEDGDDHIDHLLHPCLDHYVKSCLKMNISVKGKMQYLLTDYKEPEQTKLSDMNIKYLNLIDELCKLMESCDPGVFTDKCAGLMARDIHNIPLFSDKVLKDFGEYHNVSIMLRYLMCYFTWRDLSVVQQLLETCGYPDGVRLLNNFKHSDVDKTNPDDTKVST